MRRETVVKAKGAGVLFEANRIALPDGVGYESQAVNLDIAVAAVITEARCSWRR